jgi:hypothetical protein
MSSNSLDITVGSLIKLKVPPFTMGIVLDVCPASTVDRANTLEFITSTYPREGQLISKFESFSKLSSFFKQGKHYAILWIGSGYSKLIETSTLHKEAAKRITIAMLSAGQITKLTQHDQTGPAWLGPMIVEELKPFLKKVDELDRFVKDNFSSEVNPVHSTRNYPVTLYDTSQSKMLWSDSAALHAALDRRLMYTPAGISVICGMYRGRSIIKRLS